MYRNLHTETHICTCKNTKKDPIELLPLMRVPVTSLCKDKANLISPCLQRLAHPVILTVSWDTAGSTEPEQDKGFQVQMSSCSSLRSKCQSIQLLLLLLVGCMNPTEESMLFLLCRLSPCWAEGRKENRNGDLPLLSLPHSSSAFSIPLLYVSKLVTAWGVYVERQRERERKCAKEINLYCPSKTTNGWLEVLLQSKFPREVRF